MSQKYVGIANLFESLKGGEVNALKRLWQITQWAERGEKSHSLIWDMKIYRFNNFRGGEFLGFFGIPLNYETPALRAPFK